MSIKYFPTYSLGRYTTIAANSKDDIIPTSFDFRVLDNEEYSSKEECDSLCRALNIAVRGNYDEHDSYEFIPDERIYNEFHDIMQPISN